MLVRGQKWVPTASVIIIYHRTPWNVIIYPWLKYPHFTHRPSYPNINVQPDLSILNDVSKHIGKSKSVIRYHCKLSWNGVTTLTFWGGVTHICVSKLTIIDSDNGLSPGRRQAIILTNAVILWIWPLGTKFREILIEIYIFSFNKMHLKMSSAKWHLFCASMC